MAFLEILRRNIWKRACKKANEERTNRRSFSFKTAKTAIVYFKYSGKENFSTIARLYDFLKGESIEVNLVAFIPKEKETEADMVFRSANHVVFSLNESDISFAYMLKKAARAKIEPILKNSFDIFLNLEPNMQMFDTYLAYKIPAAFKIGQESIFSKNSPFDLNIITKDKMSLEVFVEQVKHYFLNF